MNRVVDSWPALSFLEGLRPSPNESVELALLASYSADLGSIGAALLALAGKDNDAGRGSPSDFADAVERLRGKVRIIIQRGRLAKMRRTPRIAAVLDQFVREVDFDEAIHSWHPKAALVQMKSESGVCGWRLWIGSRNLTECVNRDIGLLLASGGRGGSSIPGVGDLARGLAERAELKGVRPASLAASVTKILWRAPAGLRVEGIRWSTGSGGLQPPAPAAGADEIVVVSPFIDRHFLAEQTSKGPKSARRILLTTMHEIQRLGPSLSSFDDLLALDAPDYPTGDPELELPEAGSASDSNAADAEEEETGGGLHAKLLFIRTGSKRTLWFGSANATMRAWTGRNVEVTAELHVNEELEKGLKALLGSARIAEVPGIEYQPDAATLEEEALERARTQVAARWAAALNVDGEEIRLVHGSILYPDGPHPDETDMLLEVAALHGDFTEWPRRQVVVPLGPTPSAEQSEFVRLRVSRGDKGLSWLQRAPANPPFGEERDRAAFVRFLGGRGFLLWLAALLADGGRDGDEDWTIEKLGDRVSASANPALDPALPTLEEILAAWARDQNKFHEVERRVSEYLPAVMKLAAQEDLQTAAMLRRFEELWEKLRIGLGTENRERRR